MAVPIGPIASAIAAVTKLLDKFLSNSKGRKVRRALISARRGLNRAVNLYPKLKKDKHFAKHKKNFEKNLI